MKFLTVCVLFALFVFVKGTTLPDEKEPTDFPGFEFAVFPQNAGGGAQVPPVPHDGDFFGVLQQTIFSFTTGITGGLSGGYPGQITNVGVDPVRGTIVLPGGVTGASGSHVTGRGGVGGGSGNGFGMTQTKFPDRLYLGTNQFINHRLNTAEGFHYSSASSTTASLLFVVVAVVALLF